MKIKAYSVLAGIVFLLNFTASYAEDSKGSMGSLTNWVKVINDLNIRLKVFNADGSVSSGGLGFDYDFSKSTKGITLTTNSQHPVGLTFNLEAKGSVAFDKDKNPNNFLESGGDLRLRYAHHLKIRPIDTNDMPSQQALLYFDLKAKATFESDQSFSKKQGAYGARLGFQPLDFSDADKLSWWNILDYPFALIRWGITGVDSKWTPSGTFPTILVGYDLVDPITDAPRFVVDADKSPYGRLSGEVTFATIIAEAYEKPIKIGASYRYFQETSASSAIKAAGFDKQEYFVAYLEFRDFTVSYATGKLPLDRTDDHVFALGYKLNF
jgi:hypothetical protein